MEGLVLRLVSLYCVSAVLVFSVIVPCAILGKNLNPAADRFSVITSPGYNLKSDRDIILKYIDQPNLKIVDNSGSTKPNRLKSFQLYGIDICHHMYRKSDISNGQTYILGSAPSNPLWETVTPPQIWPDRDPSWEILQRNFANNNNSYPNFASSSNVASNHFEISHQRKCYVIDHEDNIHQAWEFTFKSTDLPWRATVTEDEILTLYPLHIPITGSARIWKENKTSNELTDYELNYLTGTTYLDGQYFFTINSDGTRASSATHTFNYDPDTEFTFFAEVSLFTNAQKMLDWFRGAGFTKFGTKKIGLKAHASINGDINNAFYSPATNDSEDSYIYIGDGDGNILQNLATDSDVIHHELSHHIIYTAITQISGESLVLHEGLADFFSFAKSDDYCLGESICPDPGSGVCALPKQCLRSANNNYTLDAANLPSEEHLRGQLISGTLWDLYKEDGIPKDNIVRMILFALNFLVSNSGYADFFESMLVADREKYASYYCSTMRQRFILRGFENHMNNYTCVISAGVQPENQVITPDQSNSTSSSTSEEKKSGGVSCGTINKKVGNTYLLWFLLPLILCGMETFKYRYKLSAEKRKK